MDQEIPVVHQDPLSGVVAFDADGAFSPILKNQSDLIADCLALANIGNRTDYKVISKRGHRLQI